MERLLANCRQRVGNTPMIGIESLSSDKVKVWAKLEWHQIGNSVKARAAFHIMQRAWSEGELQGRTLLDASSGNTAIAYAAIGRVLQIPVHICIPSNASEKRKQVLRSLGASLHWTSEMEGTDGAQAVAQEIQARYPEKYFYADQYGNPSNQEAHVLTTSREIWQQRDGRISHFVAGLGTTGTFTGTTRGLKDLGAQFQAIALQPDSPLHIMEGWKHLETAKVPSIFDPSQVDATASISSESVMDMIRFIARKEGLLLSPSAAANLVGAQELAHTLEEGDIVTVLADDISKYDEVLKMIQL
ncbi:MAG: cysteine synthase family protein [Flavobacteriales bacterium]|nr:cysteine synthase family protein [Flavobacteriales bacterium]